MKKYLSIVLYIFLGFVFKTTHGQTYNVSWTNAIGVDVSSNTLIVNPSAAGWGNAGASSLNILPANTNGYVQVTPITPGTRSMVGFSQTDVNLHFNTINFAVYITLSAQNTPMLQVYESGNLMIPSQAFSYGDIIKVERVGASIQYKINNAAPFYTSLTASSSALIVDAALNYGNIDNAIASFPVPSGCPGVSPVIATLTSTPSGSTFTAGQQITFNCTPTDADNNLNRVEYFNGATLLGSSTTAINYPFSYTFSTAGTYSISAKAVDNCSNQSASSNTISLTISSSSPGSSSQWTGTTSGIYYNSHVHIGKGNLNTGTDSGYSLFVRNGIKTEKIKVEVPTTSGATGWADHVFYPDYKQMPIRDLEKFIKTNKHLPGFPSIKTILKDGGYEITDMIKRQQESIENLHLYIIELEKNLSEMKSVKNKNVELEARLVKLENLIRKN